jgi:hypothetical protein
MRRLKRIRGRAWRKCFGLMRSTHMLSVEVLVGLPPIRQRLLFLNERLLVSVLFRVNDLLLGGLEELHQIWNNLNCFLRRQSSWVVRWYRGHTLSTQGCAYGFEGNLRIAISYNCSETPEWGVWGASGSNRHLYQRFKGLRFVRIWNIFRWKGFIPF